MKIRIKDNSIRLRLTKSEVDDFVNNGIVEGRTEFLTGQSLTYALSKSTSFDASFNEGKIRIALPEELVNGWQNNPIVGFDHEFNNGLKILVEKDFKCLTPREEDESDHFENPLEKHNC